MGRPWRPPATPPRSARAREALHLISGRSGEIEAVRGIDFDVAPGEVFGFLGPNGAGKSTTISMLCTLVKPTGARRRVAGHDVGSERDAVRRNIGLVFQDTTLDGYLTAAQNMRLHAELYGVPRELLAATDAPGAGDGRAVGAPRQPGRHVLGRDEAAA